MTGFTWSSSRTRSPMTIVCSSTLVKAAQAVRPIGGVIGTPATVTLMSAVPARASHSFDRSAGDVFNAYDHAGNLISASNRFDGTSSYVQLTSFNRYGNANWDHSHSDDFTERVTALYLDAADSILVV